MKYISNDEPLNPAVFKLAGYVDFYAIIYELCEDVWQPLTYDQYAALAKRAIRLKKQHPILRAVIAYDMVCVGAELEGEHSHDSNHPAKILWDLFADLEVPDRHVVSKEEADRGDFSKVERKWQQIEDLVTANERK